jgi:hypothetical protein
MNRKKTPLILEMLRNWYFVDSVLLNDHSKHCITDNKDYQEYISLKAAMISDLYEFYNYIGYCPKINSLPQDHRQIQEMAVKAAKKTKSVSARMIESKSFKDHMRSVILKEFKNTKSSDVKSISDRIINERFLKISLDNMLLGVPIIECTKQNKISDFKGQLLEQAYLTIRSEMLKIAKKYNTSFFQEGWPGGLAKFGLVVVAGFALAGAVGRAIEAFSNRCESRCGVLTLNTAAKKACVLKCRIQTQQKIISALRQSAAQTNNIIARNKFAKDVKRAQLRMTQYQRQLARLSASRAGTEKLEPEDQARLF